MQIQAHAGLLLVKASLRLLHVLYHAVLGHELAGFILVVNSGRSNEWFLEVYSVNLQCRLGVIILVQAERHKRIDDVLDLRLLDGLAVSLLFDQIQHSLHDLLMDLHEEVVFPFDEVQSVHIVDILLALVDLPLHPVAVQVAEEVVDVFGSSCVTNPFTYVKP